MGWREDRGEVVWNEISNLLRPLGAHFNHLWKRNGNFSIQRPIGNSENFEKSTFSNINASNGLESI